MNGDELMAWGRAEEEQRKADVAKAKASNDIGRGLAEAHAAAEQRRRAAKLSAADAQRAIGLVQSERRMAEFRAKQGDLG